MTTLINTTDYANTHVLSVDYIGATNYRGSRIKIGSDRFKQTKTIGYNHNYNSILGGAMEWLINKGFVIIGYGESKNGYYIITSTFEPLNA